MKDKLLIILITVSILILILLGINWKSIKQETFNEMPNNIYEKTIKIAADKDFAPYSFMNKYGNPAGLDVQLAYKICDELNVNADFQLMDWNDAIESLKNGSIDLLMGTTFSKEREEYCNFTYPVYNDSYVVFHENKKINSINDIFNKRIATLQGDNINEMFLEPYFFDRNTLYFDGYTQAFYALINKKVDLVIAPYNMGISTLANMNQSHVQSSGIQLSQSIFCIGVSKSNYSLLYDVNTTLKHLMDNDQLKKIKDRWLLEFIPNFSFKNMIKQNINSFIIILLVFLIILLAIYYFLEKKYSRNLYIQTEQAKIYKELSDNDLFEYNPKTDIFSSLQKTTDGEIQKKEIDNFLNESKYTNYIAQPYQDVLEESVNKIIALQDVDSVNLQLSLNPGKEPYRWYNLKLRNILDQSKKIIKIIGQIEDINESMLKNEEITKRANIDTLTGVFRREALYEQINEILKQERVRSYALFIIDIDKFKSINDTYGHTVGDFCLKKVSKILERVFNADDLIGRFGGDEFLVFLVNPIKEILIKKAVQVNNYLKTTTEKTEYKISCSIGISFKDKSVPYQTTFDEADKLMYKQKQEGGNGYLINTTP